MTGKDIRNFLLATILIIVLSLVSSFTVGFLQAIAGILISVIIGVMSTKYHYGYVFASASTAFVVPIIISVFSGSSFIEGITFATVLSLPMILIGFVLGIAANLKFEFSKTILMASVLYLVGSLINIKVLSMINPDSFNIQSIVSMSVNEINETVKTMYAHDPDTRSYLTQIIGAIGKALLTLSPALFIVISLAIGYVSTILFKKINSLCGANMNFWPVFSNMRPDRAFTIIFVIIFFLNTAAPMGLFSDACANVELVLSCVFFVFGLSFLDWKFKNGGMKKWTRRMLLIVMVLACTMFMVLPLLIVIMFGVTDGLFGIRQRADKNDLPDGK